MTCCVLFSMYDDKPSLLKLTTPSLEDEVPILATFTDNLPNLKELQTVSTQRLDIDAVGFSKILHLGIYYRGIAHHLDPERFLNLRTLSLHFSNTSFTRAFSSDDMAVDLARFDKLQSLELSASDTLNNLRYSFFVGNSTSLRRVSVHGHFCFDATDFDLFLDHCGPQIEALSLVDVSISPHWVRRTAESFSQGVYTPTPLRKMAHLSHLKLHEVGGIFLLDLDLPVLRHLVIETTAPLYSSVLTHLLRDVGGSLESLSIASTRSVFRPCDVQILSVDFAIEVALKLKLSCLQVCGPFYFERDSWSYLVSRVLPDLQIIHIDQPAALTPLVRPGCVTNDSTKDQFLQGMTNLRPGNYWISTSLTKGRSIPEYFVWDAGLYHRLLSWSDADHDSVVAHGQSIGLWRHSSVGNDLQRSGSFGTSQLPWVRVAGAGGCILRNEIEVIEISDDSDNNEPLMVA